MQRALVLVILVGVCACGSSKAKNSPQSRLPSLAIAANALRNNLLAAHATFDGALITDLRQTARCEGVIATRRGSMPVRWKDLGALIERLKDGQRVFYVPFGGRPHIISVRNGAAADGIGMGLGLLDEECGGVKPAV